MNTGYSEAIIAAVNKAPEHLLGVRLGKACIANDVPVAYVAKKLNLSRTTIYSWFKGVTTVPLKHTHQVFELIKHVNELD